MKKLLCCAALAAAFASGVSRAGETIYELRTYTTREGRMPALLMRFRDHTLRLFEKHGMRNLGYWQPVDEADGAGNTLIFLLGHAGRDAARASWAAFGADPEWQAAAKASEADGKILARNPESIFLRTADFSPGFPAGETKGGRAFELRIYTTPEGKLDDLHARFRNHTIGLFEKHGMTHIAYFTPIDESQGAANTLIYFLAHPSKEAGLEAFRNFRADPAWVEAKAASEAGGPLTIPDGVKSIYLEPLDFSPLK